MDTPARKNSLCPCRIQAWTRNRLTLSTFQAHPRLIAVAHPLKQSVRDARIETSQLYWWYSTPVVASKKLPKLDALPVLHDDGIRNPSHPFTSTSSTRFPKGRTAEQCIPAFEREDDNREGNEEHTDGTPCILPISKSDLWDHGSVCIPFSFGFAPSGSCSIDHILQL